MESFSCFLQVFMVLVLVLYYHHQTCDAENTNHQIYCPPSSCGKITDIQHPFRLKNDLATCGDPRYELSCENNITMLSLFSGKYYVKSIDYKNYTIRLVDPGIQEDDCSSIPRYFLTKSNFTSSYNYNYHGDPYEVGGSGPVIYLNCSNPAKNDIMYVDTSPCVKRHSKGYVYAIAGDIYTASLNVDCRVMLVSMSSLVSTSIPWLQSQNIYRKNLSYSEIHGMLSYGFDLSWTKRVCEDSCGINQQHCNIDQSTGHVRCASNFCFSPLGIQIKCGK